jgi:PKHD-type hydroxylase
MLLTIPNLFTPEQVAQIRQRLDSAEWVDGRVTAGHQSTLAKDNLQIPEGHPAAREVGEQILQVLGQNPLFVSATLPLKVFPPLFNRYSGGQSFGTHIDNSIRHLKGTGLRVRSDLSATLFFSAPDEYDGGELIIEDTYGIHSVKLPAGHMVVYPSSSLHQVRPVTRGARVSSFFWIQSMVRDDSARTILFDLDNVAQHIAATDINSPNAVKLTGIYHNLLRRWAEL